jgi:hypothetical protein
MCPCGIRYPADEKRLYARMMEVYAGFMSFTDHHFGRILDFLREIGELDNTLIILISDNGASSEGGPVGSLNEMFFFNNVKESLEDNLEDDRQAGRRRDPQPLRLGLDQRRQHALPPLEARDLPGRHHRPVHRVVAQGHPGPRRDSPQYGHIIDFVPTVLEALGMEAPESIRGVTQAPIDGISFAHTFNEAEAPSNHHTQYFEMFGHRSIYHDGWRAVCPWPGPNFTEAAKKGRQFGMAIPNEVLVDIETHDWELYHVAEDYSETHNLAGERRDKLIEMIGRWWAEAGKYNVLPIDGDVRSRLTVERPTIAKPRDKVVLYPGGSSIPFAATPKLYNRPWSITADVVIPPGGAEGVLLAQGGRTGGYVFFVKDQRLHFLYNFIGRDKFWLHSNETIPEGEVELRYEFEPTGKPNPPRGTGCRRAASSTSTASWWPSIDMPYSILFMFGTQGLSCGYDAGDPAAPEEYSGEFRFTGTIKRVTIDLSGELIPDSEADMRVAMARQ